MNKESAARILASVTLLALITHLLSFYLRLGYVLPLVWLIGSVAAVLIAIRQHEGQSRGAFIAGLVGFGSYMLMLVSIWAILFDSKSVDTFRGSLELREDSSGSEVVLRFLEHPNHYLSQPYDPGQTTGLMGSRPEHARVVSVEIEATRDLGCVRGFNVISIDGLAFDSRGYRSGVEGQHTMWIDPWWCP